MRVIHRSAVAAFAAALLATSLAACGPEEEADAAANPSASATDDKPDLQGLPSLEDLKKWKDGGWRNWDDWADKAAEFVNPVIENLWQPERMTKAKQPDVSLRTQSNLDAERSEAPPPVADVKEVQRPYHKHMAPIGKIFFDSPKGPMVCSGTVVKDPANPGRSNLVWTAGHCVHGGRDGGWMRNIIFVPSFNDNGVPAEQIETSGPRNVAPYGRWWATEAATSGEWIKNGTQQGNPAYAYDYAVLRVKPENGGTKSLEETVGAAVPIWFNGPRSEQYRGMSVYGYPADRPFDGSKMMTCTSPVTPMTWPGTPSMHRGGCPMTGGSSGGGWFATNERGETVLVSHTSLVAYDRTFSVGPYLGTGAEKVFQALSRA